jgi:hypothetical protein
MKNLQSNDTFDSTLSWFAIVSGIVFSAAVMLAIMSAAAH